MFQELSAFLAHLASLSLTLVGNTDGTLTVTVTPKGAKVAGALDTPLSLTGTPAELDAEFANILASYSAKRLSLAEQVAATEAILEAAKNEATEKAKKSIAKPSKTVPAKSAATGGADEDDDRSDDDDNNDSCSESATSESSSTTTKPAATEADLWA